MLMLFLELALIRWTGANVLHLSYFSNFVLLGSFLGIGLGFLRTKPNRPVRPYYSPVTLLALVGFVLAFPVVVDRQGSDAIFFTSLDASGPPVWVVLPVIFLAVAAIMAGPGELVAACFHQLPRLDAYRLDLVGSLIGIGAFTVLSFAGAPSALWGLVVGALFLVLLGPPARGVTVATAIGLVALLYGESTLADDDVSVTWSPYYKITTHERSESDGGSSLMVSVNGIPHQRVTLAERRERQEPQYTVPYQRIATRAAGGNAQTSRLPTAEENLQGLPQLLARGQTPAQPTLLDRVLIVGAGTGTDVAIALRHGAQHIDAVEIDPKLAQLGRERNPDHVYADPRVSVHVDDGRAFLERTGSRYNLILFALPDSLTLVSGASSLRLESYLFTEQAMAAARDHLAPGGAFAMYNFYREAWLVDRLAGTLDTVFGHPPCVDVKPDWGQQAVMVVGLRPADQRCVTTWARSAATPAPSTDDHPFLYIRDGAFPTLYVVALLLILAVSALTVRVAAGTPLRRMAPYRDLFLLGAAFLLLETKSVTGFALLFGTTWVVNALVFAGVLIAVLGAVETTRRFPTPPLRVMYGVLLGGLALAWVVPSSWLLSLPVAPRAALAIAIAFLPIFAANVIFSKRFATTPEPTIAFGANLLGAMVGGCLEYLALITGYNALLVVAAALYLGAYAVRPRRAIDAVHGLVPTSSVIRAGGARASG
jgi:tRNA1(Val) A37 N6-methylase TrmN6